MRIGDEVLIHGYVDEIRKDIVIIQNDGGYFGTVKTEILNREQTRWISVNERLPEVMDGTNGECSDDVLICVADDENITISTGFYGYYPRSTSRQGWWSMWAYGCHQLDSRYKVIAWMPLPEPYKAESEEEE